MAKTTVTVVMEQSAGGSGVCGVYASRMLAEAAHDRTGWMLQHESERQVVWTKPAIGRALIFQDVDVIETLPAAPATE